MYILNITKVIKATSINEMKDFFFKHCYKKFEFSKTSVIIQ